MKYFRKYASEWSFGFAFFKAYISLKNTWREKNAVNEITLLISRIFRMWYINTNLSFHCHGALHVGEKRRSAGIQKYKNELVY